MNLFEMQKKLRMVNKENALQGREQALRVSNEHYVLKVPIKGPFPQEYSTVIFGMGCFWGAERLFWQKAGVYSTAVGYSGGHTPNPTYEEVCSGQTAHNEVVLLVFDSQTLSFEALLETFWTSHNPTQGMRQANDIGTQYRSGIYCTEEEQMRLALASRDAYQAEVVKRTSAEITTEIVMASEFYYAEDYHQQYLAKNPGGYCNLQTADKTGLPCWPE